jgi:hypothetical protein
MKNTFLRRILPWLIVAGIAGFAGFAVYKLNVKPVEVIVPNATQSEVDQRSHGHGHAGGAGEDDGERPHPGAAG